MRELTPIFAEDWSRLRNAAAQAATKAYAPYSSYPVGAAALTESGRIVTGANIENASYGVTLCAECSLVSEAVMSGAGRLTAFVCLDGAGETIAPCGRCRQLLYEHRAATGLQILTPAGVLTIDELLPQAFGPDNLRSASPHD